jgi:hypothetical protein
MPNVKGCGKLDLKILCFGQKDEECWTVSRRSAKLE